VSPVAVLVPTLRRPESLARALQSLFAQSGLGDRAVELVVVDNDPAGSARATVEALRGSAPWPLSYVHEPRPGVATARNTGLRAVAAPLVAFLDDDEEATPGWLAALLDTQAETAADAVFGPIAGRAPDAPAAHRAYLEAFFSRAGPARSGPLEHAFGCGNSLLVRATALPGPAPFDVAADETGGEDDVLFAGLKGRGGRFAWAAEALAYEHAPAHRARLGYALRRAFAYGQGPSQTCAREGDVAGVARWMTVGLGQAALFGAAAAVLWALRRPGRAAMLDRAVRGVGKVFWMSGLEPQLYGRAELARAAAG
jgi:glycosyltransferase involved in cell wall biosynthesis